MSWPEPMIAYLDQQEGFRTRNNRKRTRCNPFPLVPQAQGWSISVTAVHSVGKKTNLAETMA